MNTKIMQLEKRHRDIMKYTGGDMISFVLTCTELQKDMLTEIERLYERNIRTRFIKERLLYQKYR